MFSKMHVSVIFPNNGDISVPKSLGSVVRKHKYTVILVVMVKKNSCFRNLAVYPGVYPI